MAFEKGPRPQCVVVEIVDHPNGHGLVVVVVVFDIRFLDPRLVVPENVWRLDSAQRGDFSQNSVDNFIINQFFTSVPANTADPHSLHCIVNSVQPVSHLHHVAKRAGPAVRDLLEILLVPRSLHDCAHRGLVSLTGERRLRRDCPQGKRRGQG